MKYFSQFPSITTTDYKGNSINVTNILARTEIIPSLLRDTVLFYNYDIQQSDTPDIVTYKYYEDVNRFWFLPYSNAMLDPQCDWPMNPSLFTDYIIDKYQGEANTYYSLSSGTNANTAQIFEYTQGTIKNYIKTVTTTDSYSGLSNTTNYIIDQTAYNNTQQISGQAYSFADGSSVTVSVTLSTQSIYEYEVSQNEAKRNINILNKDYAGTIEKQFSALMRL